MSGLFTGLLLSRAGWQVDVFERIGSELSGRGAGIVTHAELFDVLHRVGIDRDTAQLGVPCAGRRVLRPRRRDRGRAGPAAGADLWGHLYGLLRAGVPRRRYHHGRSFDGWRRRRPPSSPTSPTARRRGRSPDRHGRHLLDRPGPARTRRHARTMPAISPGAAWSRKRNCRPPPATRCATTSLLASPPASRCSATPSPVAARPWRRGSAASTSSGTARRQPRHYASCSPTSTACPIRSRSRPTRSGRR